MATFRLFRHYIRIPFLFLGIVEVTILILSVYAGGFIRFHKLPGAYLPPDSTPLIIRAIIIAFVMILSMVALELYQARFREGILGFLQRLATSLLLGTVGLTLVFYLFPNLFIGRGVFAWFLVVAFISISIIRALFYYYAHDLFKRNILVLGSGLKANSITELRRSADQSGFNILGFIHVRGEHDVIDPNRIIYLNMPLADFAIRNSVTEIIVAVDDRRKDFLPHELLTCKMAGINVIELPTFFEREIGKIRLDYLHPSWLVFSDGFRKNAFNDAIKRTFDLVAATILFLIVWPFMLLTTLAITLEGGFGKPVLYRQIRIGKLGEPFAIFKFRSMTVDAEKNGKVQWASKNDTRVTRVGAFIRKVRLDELPQLWNVIHGDMSFVGPRPERPQFVVELANTIPYYQERHHVKPGITGWAQLCYPYGASEKDAKAKLEFDLYYVKNHSLLLDISILLQTVATILFSKGAR